MTSREDVLGTVGAEPGNDIIDVFDGKHDATHAQRVHQNSGYNPITMKPRLRWRRVLAGGFLAELSVFAIVFPVLYLFGQQAFLASILIASAMMPFIFAMWVGGRLESRFALHGALVGVVAALIYITISWGQPQPLLYKISHGFKVAGGLAGGLAASRRRIPATPVLKS